MLEIPWVPSRFTDEKRTECSPSLSVNQDVNPCLGCPPGHCDASQPGYVCKIILAFCKHEVLIGNKRQDNGFL